MMIKVTSHRAHDSLVKALRHKLECFYTWTADASFVKIAENEAEKALKIKGVSKCRKQDETKYRKCQSFT